MDSTDLKGVIPAIVTPFRGDEQLDEQALSAIVEYVVSNGVHGIMTTGGTGEFPLLSREERRQVTQIVSETARGRVPIIAGTAACSTREAIQLAEDAAQAGATAIIVTPPFYFILPEQPIYQHFAELVRNSPVPVVIYNNPLYTGNSMAPGLIARLLELDNVIGLKQSQSDLGQLVEVLRLADHRSAICTGIDSQFYAALCIGAAGIFSTAATICPRQMVELYDLVRANCHDNARALHRRLQLLNRYLEYDPGYVAPAKEALNLLGLPGGQGRRPMPTLTPDEMAGLRSALQELNMIPA